MKQTVRTCVSSPSSRLTIKNQIQQFKIIQRYNSSQKHLSIAHSDDQKRIFMRLMNGSNAQRPSLPMALCTTINDVS
jgi:hypothetical protein